MPRICAWAAAKFLQWLWQLKAVAEAWNWKAIVRMRAGCCLVGLGSATLFVSVRGLFEIARDRSIRELLFLVGVAEKQHCLLCASVSLVRTPKCELSYLGSSNRPFTVNCWNRRIACLFNCVWLYFSGSLRRIRQKYLENWVVEFWTWSEHPLICKALSTLRQACRQKALMVHVSPAPLIYMRHWA